MSFSLTPKDVFRYPATQKASSYPAGLQEVAARVSQRCFIKGNCIFQAGSPCEHFYLVLQGLVKTYVNSLHGTRITYLLSRQGEPLNLVGPFTGKPRLLEAQAIQDCCIGYIPRQDFLVFTRKHPVIITNIISILGFAIDSANNRIIDLLEKKVDQRLYKVLYTLYSKFGPRLGFTSQELADLGGTTVESTLRSMQKLRSLGLIRTKRGEVEIIKPEELKKIGQDVLWV